MYWVFAEIKYWILKLLCALRITDWYPVFRPWDIKNMVSDDIEPLFTDMINRD